VASRHEDDRGVIRDLLTQPLDAVTEIFTRAGAVRGNHKHRETTQWTYIVSGRMQVAQRFPQQGIRSTTEHGPGELICDWPGVEHAWKALEDTRVLVFTRGPRSGEGYETDTCRLKVPLL